jgi:hypothetical protein
VQFWLTGHRHKTHFDPAIIRHPSPLAMEACRSRYWLLSDKIQYRVRKLDCWGAGEALRGANLQDILRLLTLWFNHGNSPEVEVALNEGFGHVSIDTWLVVIPQVSAPYLTSAQLPLQPNLFKRDVQNRSSTLPLRAKFLFHYRNLYGDRVKKAQEASRLVQSLDCIGSRLKGFSCIVLSLQAPHSRCP